jgi:hypothetical protein
LPILVQKRADSRSYDLRVLRYNSRMMPVKVRCFEVQVPVREVRTGE